MSPQEEHPVALRRRRDAVCPLILDAVGDWKVAAVHRLEPARSERCREHGEVDLDSIVVREVGHRQIARSGLGQHDVIAVILETVHAWLGIYRQDHQSGSRPREAVHSIL